jgi:hypothetical protein
MRAHLWAMSPMAATVAVVIGQTESARKVMKRNTCTSHPIAATTKRAAPHEQVNIHEAQFDLSKLKSRKNRYTSKLKRPVTMRQPEGVVPAAVRMSVVALSLSAVSASEVCAPWITDAVIALIVHTFLPGSERVALVR